MATGDGWGGGGTWTRSSTFAVNRKRYLYRAVDQHGQVVDILLRDKRDRASAEAFFRRALGQTGTSLAANQAKSDTVPEKTSLQWKGKAAACRHLRISPSSPRPSSWTRMKSKGSSSARALKSAKPSSPGCRSASWRPSPNCW